MKKYILNILILISTFCVNAQSYIGYLTDNYSGVNGVVSNPANIVDSRFKTDINLIGASVFGTNDFYEFNTFDVLKSDYDFDIEPTETFTTNNNLGINLDVLGPSFMVDIDDINSIAVFTRLRAFSNVNKINGATIDLLNEDTDDLDNILINEEDFYSASNLWGEIGVSYGRVLYNEGEHFLKGGVSLKYLRGAVSTYTYGTDVVLEIQEDENNPDIQDVTADGIINYGNSIGVENIDEFEANFDSIDGVGFGVDLGFIYEWRPDHKDDMYNLKHINKYKVKLGLSVTDIGNINYEEGIDTEYILDLDSNNFNDLTETSSDSFLTQTSTIGYKIKLPTALHINADYNYNDKFYLNLNTDFSLISKATGVANSISNIVSLTPRYESKWISAYIPLSVVQFSGFQAGLGLRAGPLYIGSGSILSVLAKGDNAKGGDVYAGLKIPIYHGGAKDKDGDGVVDKEDPCPKIAGPKENNGCPWEDSDGDGVMDNEDKCIQEAGPKENNGCPIIDIDGDGVIDKYDKCPKEAGPKENNGCPVKDMDEDGVSDDVDLCPKKAGLKENGGCPDTDGDGVFDNVDKCPDIKGKIEKEGCPVAKTVAPIKKEKLKELQAFARAIYFNPGRSTFKPGVRAKLDIIAGIMNENPKANFNIEGHTDSQGAASTNKALSEKRAKAVVTYLITKSVASSRLSSIGYGEDYPISENDTKDGRALNRRVEIKLLK